jgi:hypothetical protein
MTIRTQLKAGRLAVNHSEAVRVRSTIKAGGQDLNHNEALQRAADRQTEERDGATNIVWMRRQPLTRSRTEDRLTLLVVRAGLRAGRRARARARH